ncbi:MAG: tetratricopeptide repeat protein [Bacteroidia bacterium]
MKNFLFTSIAVGLVLAVSLMSGCSSRTSEALKKTQTPDELMMAEANVSKELIEQQSGRTLLVMPVTTESDRALSRFEAARKYRHDFIHLDDSYELLRQALALDPEFALAHVYMAMHHGTKGNTEAEKREMDLAQRYSDKVSKGERMFIAAMLQGPTTTDIWLSLEQMYPDDKYIHLILGYIYKNSLRDYDAALGQFQKSLALDGTLGNAYNMIGYTYIARGDFQKAEEAFQTYMDLFPYAGNPYDSMGDLYVKTGRYQEAIALFEKAYAVEPAFTWSRDKANEVRTKLEKSPDR